MNYETRLVGTGLLGYDVKFEPMADKVNIHNKQRGMKHQQWAGARGGVNGEEVIKGLKGRWQGKE